MKITLLLTGKTDAGYWSDALKDYAKRVKHYAPFEIVELPDIKDVRNMSEQQQKVLEGSLILQSVWKGDFLTLLDERGKGFSSTEFAAWIEKKMVASVRRLVFAVGGPYGFSESVYRAASYSISLSRMTFSHQMIRPLFVEQLYRAMTILRGEKYHH
jgi:23S rRNA (pseudouridine1915-N3)-methyltransferase